MSKKLIIGNWKMNPSSSDEAKKIIRKIRKVAAKLLHTDVVACPPFVFLDLAVSKRSSVLKVGAQTVSSHEGGAHTGEVSATMLKDIGAGYVIVGHSEEREDGLSNEAISKRVRAVTEAGMKAVLCVGEKERDDGGLYLENLKDQIRGSLVDVPDNLAKNIILAYEPVWAIGAKEAMNPQQIHETTLFVRKVFSDVFNRNQAMKALVLYGGSVNFRNAYEIMTIGQVDGLLVGRESVNAPGFIELLKAVDKV